MTNPHPFLPSGGEMGDLIRHYDWSATPVGPMESWPISLRVQVTLLLNARFPMLLFWGPQLTTWYNDAFRSRLGNDDKHPGYLGHSGPDIWAESWSLLGPLIEAILAGGEAVWAVDQQLPVFQKEQLAAAHWTYCFSPIVNDIGAVSGVLLTCLETNQAVENPPPRTQPTAVSGQAGAQTNGPHQTQPEVDAQFRHVADRSPTGLWLSDPEGVITYLNKTLIDWTGMAYGDLLGVGWANAILAQDRQQALEAFTRAVASRTHYQTEFRIKTGDGPVIWCRAAGDPFYLPDGSYGGYAGFCLDIQASVEAQQHLRESEQRFQNLVREATVGIIVLIGEAMQVSIVNEAYARLVGRTQQELLGKNLFTVIPEAEAAFGPLITGVRTSGEPLSLTAIPYAVAGPGKQIEGYLDLVYQPYRERDGTISGVIILCQDVTEQVVARRRAEESEARLRGVIAAAPAGIGLFVGRELLIQHPNQTFIDLMGKGPGVEGLPLREAMPELLTENQPFLTILDRVFTTGVPYTSPASLVKIVQQGVLQDKFYNLSYTPLYNGLGEVYAILEIAIDVTAQVQAQQALEETQEALQGAIELAQLGTWELDLPSGQLAYSPRLRAWHGLTADEVITREQAYRFVRPADRPRVLGGIAEAIKAGGSGRYDIEYTVTIGSSERLLHAQGKAYVDEQGSAYKVAGTVQDITQQRHRQRALEQQVQERTQALAISNAELAVALNELAATNADIRTSNEQYIVLNNQLQYANRLLSQSNEDLQRFAYVASHDLQEPLRKIQQFGDLLRTEHAVALGEEVVYLERMQSAAQRMSSLIQDLLRYSRISGQSAASQAPVLLQQVVAQVLTDLELVIEETGAQISVDPLPTLIGDPSQLAHLFQNLFSNALKFRRPGIAPVISLQARLIGQADLPIHVKPGKLTQFYHQLEVVDNGIGFEPQYGQRIFGAFQRLHRKNEYAGTGIGLSISERVVTSHGGAITATSQLGQGATFSIYWPV
ncbi:PAS domain S-box protein (plasmid) [Fibrella sp. ES10-3-2-2]